MQLSVDVRGEFGAGISSSGVQWIGHYTGMQISVLFMALPLTSHETLGKSLHLGFPSHPLSCGFRFKLCRAGSVPYSVYIVPRIVGSSLG